MVIIPIVVITVLGCAALFLGEAPDPLDPTMNIVVMNPHGFPLWGILLTLLALTEFFFWMDKSKPEEGESRIEFTACHKIIAFCDGLFIMGAGGVLWWGAEQFGATFFWEALSIVACLAVSAVLLYLYIWLNAQRYKETGHDAEKKEAK